MDKNYDEYYVVKELIKKVDGQYQKDQIDSSEIDKIQKHLDNLGSKYLTDLDLGKDRTMMYELQAMIFYIQGSIKDSLKFIQLALEIDNSSEIFISKLGKKIYQKYHLQRTGALYIIFSILIYVFIFTVSVFSQWFVSNYNIEIESLKWVQGFAILFSGILTFILLPILVISGIINLIKSTD